LTGVRSEIESRLREQLERVLARMDLVTREEFEAAQAMLSKARLEQETLWKRIEALEAKLAESPPAEPAVSRPSRRKESQS
jgi:BMFP domain-containing protein YqiC